MAIMIREYLGSEGLKVDWNYPPTPMVVNEGLAAASDIISPSSIMVEIEGIHVGETRNFTWYTEEALLGSVPTWTKPYLRPLIMHHNEKDGRIIGRIRHAEYIDKNTLSNTGALLFTANVPDLEGKEQIQDGRLKTTSIGVIVHDARCSICNQNIAEEGPCEHERGQKYDGKICYWVIYRMEAKELSYVIVPSDIYSQNVKIYKPSKTDLQESMNEGVLNVAEVTNLEQQENKVIEENGDQKNPPAAPPAAGEDVEALKVKIADLEAKVKEHETTIDTLKTANGELETKANDAAKELGDTKVLLDQAQKSLTGVQGTLQTKESELQNEKTLRESAEGELINLKAQAKEGLIDKVMILRQALGKQLIVKEELDKRSEESLNDSITDLKEELTKPNDVSNIAPVNNPSLTNEDDFSNKDVKEKKNMSNIELQEGFEKLFSNIVGSKTQPNL